MVNGMPCVIPTLPITKRYQVNPPETGVDGPQQGRGARRPTLGGRDHHGARIRCKADRPEHVPRATTVSRFVDVVAL